MLLIITEENIVSWGFVGAHRRPPVFLTLEKLDLAVF